MKDDSDIKKRKVYLDIIKILAIIFVIYNHTGSNGFLAFYNVNQNVIIRVIELFISIICKTAVPLFFMCSGALILKKNLNIKNILKQTLRFIIILIVFSLLYYIFLSLGNNSPMDFKWLLKMIYSSTTFSYSGSYWFIYSYIAFLLITPFLLIIARNITEKDIIYLLVLCGIFSGILPVAEYIMKLDHMALQIPLVLSANVIYPIIGYYYDNNEFKNDKLLFSLALISIIISGIFTWKNIQNGNFTGNYLSLFGVFNVLFIFITIKKSFSKIELSKVANKIIPEISKCVFGVFLIHGFTFTIIDDYFISNNYFDCIIKTIVIFITSTGIIYIIKKIPIVNKYL